MKRFIVFFACLILSVPFLSAQTSVISGNPSVDVQVRRCIASGNDVLIDFIITCHNQWTKIVFSTNSSEEYGSRIFDDEGNLYKGGGYELNVFFEIDNKTYPNGWLELAQDIPRKMRVIVKDVDEYASKFELVKISYLGNGTSSYHHHLIIKGLPITRE